MSNQVILALPSKGALAEPTTTFLRDCGLKVHKPNPRQYTGTMPSIPGIDILFQRVNDIVYKVADGTVHLGITGYDVVCEHPHEDLIVIHNRLGYGHCKLLVAVPESWVDVRTMTDLAEVAHDFRETKQRNLRVATTYTYLAREFLHSHGIHHFTLVKAEGAIEAAPTLGYADVVVDLAQTGTTLRENHLKMLANGTIVESQACLIGNRKLIGRDPTQLNIIRHLLEFIDAALQGRAYYQVTANIQGGSAEQLAHQIVSNPVTRGLQGPTLAPIYGISSDVQWYTLTIIVESSYLLEAVEHLRAIGGRQTTATPIRFTFLEESATYKNLLNLLTSG
jgi:ATP phosphoribosyltransferase